MATSSSHLVFEYAYRDANNFKVFGELLLVGRWNDPDTVEFLRYLDGGEFFVAEQVGVPPLYEALYRLSEGITAADHVFHEFRGVRYATDDDIERLPAWGKAYKLLNAFRSTRGRWNLRLSPHFAGRVI